MYSVRFKKIPVSIRGLFVFIKQSFEVHIAFEYDELLYF